MINYIKNTRHGLIQNWHTKGGCIKTDIYGCKQNWVGYDEDEYQQIKM